MHLLPALYVCLSVWQEQITLPSVSFVLGWVSWKQTLSCRIRAESLLETALRKYNYRGEAGRIGQELANQAVDT